MDRTVQRIFFILLLLAPAVRPLSAEDSIRVGAVFSVTGYAARYGVLELQGTQLAVEEINASGGVLGRKLELLVEDNKSSSVDTVSAFLKLASQGVVAVLGPNFAEFSEAVAPAANRSGVVMLTASGWTTTLTLERPYVFTSFPSHDLVLEPLALEISAQGVPDITIIRNENGYLESISNALERELSKRGIKVIEAVSISSEGADYRSLITRLKRQGRKNVFFCLLQDGQNSAFLKQVRELSYSPRFFASNNLLDESLIVKDLSIADGVTTFEYSYPIAPSSGFTQRFRARFKTEPDMGAPRAYDNVFLIADSIRRCNSAAREDIRRCLSSASYNGASGHTSFASDNNLSRFDATQFSRVLRIAQGKVVPVSR